MTFLAIGTYTETMPHVPVHGRTPRDFTLDPTGRFLLVANQDSDNIVTFRLDLQTGLPLEIAQSMAIPTPVCLQFMAD
jgi:6-phosphogluconolactonase